MGQEEKIVDNLNNGKTDLLDRDKMKILLIGDVNNIFIRDLTNQIKMENNVQLDIFTLFNKFNNNKIMFDNLYSLSNTKFGRSNKSWFYNKLIKLLYFITIKDLINNLDNYDIINIHFLSPFYIYFAKEIRRKSNVLCVSYWGSDFYRISEKEKIKQKRILDIADVITFTNDNMKEEFSNFHNEIYNSKVKTCRFGLTVLDSIRMYDAHINYIEEKDKFLQKYGLPYDKRFITCGYNSTIAQQHEAIIDQIISLEEDYKKDLFFLFPMTYGDIEYRQKIEKKLLAINLNFKIFYKFMDYDETAILRKISDIMIHVQTTDQFSGSMQEHLYAENIVINGGWLPYDILKKKGSFFLEVEKTSQLKNKISYAIENYEELKSKCKVNKSIIWELSSWESNSEEWYRMYYDILSEKG